MRDWIAHDYDESDCDWLYYAVTHEIPQVFAILQPYVECQTQVPIAIVSLGAIAVHSDHFYGSRRRFHTISFLVDTVDFLLNDVAQAFLIHFDVSAAADSLANALNFLLRANMSVIFSSIVFSASRR